MCLCVAADHLASVTNEWIHECGAFMEWHWQGKLQYSEKNLGPHSERLLTNCLNHGTTLKAVVNEDLWRATCQMIIICLFVSNRKNATDLLKPDYRKPLYIFNRTTCFSHSLTIIRSIKSRNMQCATKLLWYAMGSHWVYIAL